MQGEQPVLYSGQLHDCSTPSASKHDLAYMPKLAAWDYQT